jgi:hypothetical protein
MRRILTLVLLLAACAGGAYAGFNLHYSSGTAGIAAGDANVNTPITDNHSGGSGQAFRAKSLKLTNRGANVIHFDFDGVATTADTRLEPGVTLTFDDLGDTGPIAIGLIGPGGGLASTVDIDAWR